MLDCAAQQWLEQKYRRSHYSASQSIYVANVVGLCCQIHTITDAYLVLMRICITMGLSVGLQHNHPPPHRGCTGYQDNATHFF